MTDAIPISAFNEPLPEPNEMSAEERVRALNTIRREQLEGVDHPEQVLQWALSLLALERSSATNRSATRTNNKTRGKAEPSGPALSLADLA